MIFPVLIFLRKKKNSGNLKHGEWCDSILFSAQKIPLYEIACIWIKKHYCVRREEKKATTISSTQNKTHVYIQSVAIW